MTAVARSCERRCHAGKRELRYPPEAAHVAYVHEASMDKVIITKEYRHLNANVRR